MSARNTRNFVAGWRQHSLFAVLSGDPLDLLAEYWHDANQAWFDGKLKPVPIVAGLEATKLTMGRAGFDLRSGRYRIEIRESLLARLDEPGLYLETTDVLLHEMIHQYIAAHYLPGRNRLDEPSHGPTFTSWCNKIGSALGLPEVVARKPRGRKVPLSRYWPHSVRPRGAYALATPRRVHWSRHDGKPLPRQTALVTRPGRLGNPFVMSVEPLQTREDVIRLHREWLGGVGPDEIAHTNPKLESLGITVKYSRSKALNLLADLAGYDIACACPEGVPCHGDTLLELATKE